MKRNVIENGGILLWAIVIAIAVWGQKETTAEWVVATLYIAACAASIIDVTYANKWLTATAVTAWLLLILIGATFEFPDTFSFVARLIGLDRRYDGNGLVIGGIALVSLAILTASFYEEETKGK